MRKRMMSVPLETKSPPFHKASKPYGFSTGSFLVTSPVGGITGADAAEGVSALGCWAAAGVAASRRREAAASSAARTAEKRLRLSMVVSDLDKEFRRSSRGVYRSSFHTYFNLCHDCSGLPSTAPGLNLQRLNALRAASSSRSKPLEVSMRLSTTRPDASMRKFSSTVPVSFRRREAEG